MRCVNTENNRRKYLRPLLFNAKVEENDLGKWEEYIKLNFELPDPGAPKAVDKLRKMVETRKTPDYKGGKKGGNAKPIPPRDLDDLEYAKLEELLPIYEEKLQAWWEAKNAGQLLTKNLLAQGFSSSLLCCLF